ncbi:MAG: SAF domain-containing protein [Anaerolineales bacterium]|nr:SAF domain-containing protein [Anaerolineales bacterium]
MKISRVDKDRIQSFQEMKDIFEKSLVAEVDISAGSTLRRELVGIKKPGTGISASRLSEYLGRTLAHDIKAGTLLMEADFTESR